MKHLVRGCLALEEFLLDCFERTSINWDDEDDHDGDTAAAAAADSRLLHAPLLSTSGGADEQETPRNEDSFTSGWRPKPKFWILCTILLGIHVTFYLLPLVIHANTNGTDRALKPTDVALWMAWELFQTLVGYRAVLLCPLHIILAQQSLPQQQPSAAVAAFLAEDLGSWQIMTAMLGLTLTLVLSDNLMHMGYGMDPHLSLWMYVVAYQPILSIVSMSTVLPFALANLAARVVVGELQALCQEMQARLRDATATAAAHGDNFVAATTSHTNNGDDNPPPTTTTWRNEESTTENNLMLHDSMVQSWSLRYQALQQSTKALSKAFVPWFCTFMLLIFLELTTLMQLSYAVHVCHKEMGPKLASLAVRYAAVHPEFAAMEQAVWHYPIHFHVGTQSIHPEHATTVVVGLTTAFLVSIGLSAAGGGDDEG